MKRILYSQSENPIRNDYFVIDGNLETNNVSNLSMEAFQIVNSSENWKVLYMDEELKIKKRGNFLSMKSHYKNQDEAGRFLFYIYYIESNDIGKMLDYLKEDSKKINKDIAFETVKLIEKINKTNIKKIITGVFLTIIISLVLWEIVK
jgi:hypothetical protein